MSRQIALCLVFLCGSLLAQQSTPPDTILVPTPLISEVSRVGEYEEQVLETIKIEAIIEKPSVTFVPKRAETDVGSLPFESRSFELELQQRPDAVLNYGEDLEGGKRVKKIKKLLAKEVK